MLHIICVYVFHNISYIRLYRDFNRLYLCRYSYMASVFLSTDHAYGFNYVNINDATVIA